MRKPDVDFGALDGLLGSVFGPREVLTYARTPTGGSTQVYRLRRASETFYVRIAEGVGDCFAPEVEVHGRLRRAGATVPDVVHYEPFDERLQRSVMVTTEIPGTPVEQETSPTSIAGVARAAGRDLARVHGLPVRGFGWVRRAHGEPGWPLRAEHATYDGFVDPAAIGGPLAAIGFGHDDVRRVEDLLADGVASGPTGDSGSLAHGDFDTSHVFAAGGRYSGLIDFGEIRGTDDAFDFATLQLTMHEQTLHRLAFDNITSGYSEVRPVPDERRVYVACVLSASQRLAVWHNRDGDQAADGWFFRWIRDQLTGLLRTGRVPLAH